MESHRIKQLITCPLVSVFMQVLVAMPKNMSCIKNSKNTIMARATYFILTVCTWYCLILTESDCVFIVWYETQQTCGRNNIHLKYAT